MKEIVPGVPYDIEVTKEEIENAMLVPGEWIEKDGKYYVPRGMLDGLDLSDHIPQIKPDWQMLYKDYGSKPRKIEILKGRKIDVIYKHGDVLEICFENGQVLRCRFNIAAQRIVTCLRERSDICFFSGDKHDEFETVTLQDLLHMVVGVSN